MPALKKILVTGGSGQLAREFMVQGRQTPFSLFPLSSKDLDVSDFKACRKIIDEVRPDIILNCAAFHLVDQCEQNFPKALAVNARGPEHLASLSKEKGIFLVHFSTDYVFDGAQAAPYTEEDKTNPVNKYGESKLKGEEAVRSLLKDHLVFRLSWVFGDGRRNFAFKLKESAAAHQVLNMSTDEISAPTYTEDIVRCVYRALDEKIDGLYHLVSAGCASRFDFASYYVRKKGWKNAIVPVKAASFNLPAKRPPYSCLSNQKISSALKITLPHWKEAVDRFTARFGDRFGS